MAVESMKLSPVSGVPELYRVVHAGAEHVAMIPGRGNCGDSLRMRLHPQALCARGCIENPQRPVAAADDDLRAEPCSAGDGGIDLVRMEKRMGFPVPDPELAATTTREEPAAGLIEADGVDSSLDRLGHEEFARRVRLPELDVAPHVAGQSPLSIRRQRDAPDVSVMPGEAADVLPCHHVPKLDR